MNGLPKLSSIITQLGAITARENFPITTAPDFMPNNALKNTSAKNAIKAMEQLRKLVREKLKLSN